MKIILNGKETNMTLEAFQNGVRNNLFVVVNRNSTTITARDVTLEERLRREEVNRRVQTQRRINEIEQWFRWYDVQVNQYHRARRMNLEWYAVEPIGKKEYRSLEALDIDANEKHLEIRMLRK